VPLLRFLPLPLYDLLSPSSFLRRRERDGQTDENAPSTDGGKLHGDRRRRSKKEDSGSDKKRRERKREGGGRDVDERRVIAKRKRSPFVFRDLVARRRYEGEKHGEARIRNAQRSIRGSTGCGGATLRREDRGFVASVTVGRLRVGSSRGAPRRAAQPLRSNGPPNVHVRRTIAATARPAKRPLPFALIRPPALHSAVREPLVISVRQSQDRDARFDAGKEGERRK